MPKQVNVMANKKLLIISITLVVMGDKKYLGAMRNIQNHINAVDAANMEIKVVIHGNGIGLLQSAKSNDKLQSNIANLKSQNVAFECLR